MSNARPLLPAAPARILAALLAAALASTVSAAQTPLQTAHQLPVPPAGQHAAHSADQPMPSHPQTPAELAADFPGLPNPAARGTTAMARSLAEIFAATDWKQDPNKPAQRAAYYAQLLRNPKLTPADSVQVELQMAIELLQSGENDRATAAVAHLRQTAADAHLPLPPEFATRVASFAALAWLRVGEQENCAHLHGRRSCIFPIEGSGVHQLPRGATNAVRELSGLLERNAQDSLSQWLLNVAYMQLGRYPQDVPLRWLIKPETFKSEADLGRFEDVAIESGLASFNHAGGVAIEDFDGDGLLDIAVTSSGPEDQMHLFHNSGDGTFEDRTFAAGLLGETGGLNLTVTDFDNDGHPDLLVLRGGWWAGFGQYPMSLLHNRGDGTFEDVTLKAGLMSPHPTQTAAWADYDGDGWLDLFVGHEEGKGPGPAEPAGTLHPSQLFHNNHDGTFTEIGEQVGLAHLGYVKGVAWGDFNRDGRPDLYVSVKGGPNHLLRNDGPGRNGAPWKFTDVTREAGVAEPVESFATWFFDFDNDGWPDIFVAGYSADSMQDLGAFELGRPFHAELPRLFHNNHDGTFTDVSKQTHLDRAILTMGASFGDLDNDGFLDLYLGNGEPGYDALLPNRMFRNHAGKAFQDVTTSGGFGHLQKGHGVAFADLSNTGHEDVFEEMGGAFVGDAYQSVLFQNPGNANHSITLLLEGTRANRSGTGAAIRVSITEHGVKRQIFRTVGFGSSFGGNPLRQHIGLGAAASVDEIEIRWPGSGTVNLYTHLEADHAYRLREGSSNPELLTLKTYSSKPAVTNGESHHAHLTPAN